MHWALWDVESNNLVETVDTEDEGLQAIHEILALNKPDYIDFLALGAMYDEGEPRDVELPPALYGDALKARLAEFVKATNADASRDVHQKIRRWLAEEPWEVRDVPDPNASFNVAVRITNEQIISIIESKDRPGHIEITKYLDFSDTFQSEFAQLSEGIQRDMIWNVHHDLLLLGVEFDGPGTPLSRMRFVASIYFDGMNKDALVQRISLILRAVSLAVWTFARAVEEEGRSSAAASELRHLVPLSGGTIGPVRAAS
jgi:hypothetical protein